MLAMQATKALGATVFAVDQRQMSLDIAKELGANAIINSSEQDAHKALLDLTDGVGPDIVIDAAGSGGSLELAVSWVRNGGRVLAVAIYTSKPEFDFNSLVATEKEVVGSLAYTQQDVEEVVKLISSGQIQTTPLISDTITLDEVIGKGFERMMAPTKDVFRILVKPSG